LRSRLQQLKTDSDEDFTLAPKSLADVLRQPKLRFAFRNFLRKRQGAESLIMFEAVELYETISNPSWRTRTGNSIIEKFIVTGAVHEVNIGAALKNEINARAAANEWDEDSFKSIKRELFILMSNNFFDAFIEAYWPGGVLLAKPGDPFGDQGRDTTNSWEDDRSGGLGSNSTRPVGSMASTRPVGSTATVTSNGHLHDDETALTLAYLEV